MAAKKWIYEVKYTDGEEYTYTALDGKLKSKKLLTVRVEAENRLNAVVAAAQKWGVGWTGVARGVECEIIGPAKKIRRRIPLMERKEYPRRCAMAAGDMDGKRYRTAKRYLVWCGPARWSGYQAMLPVAYQLRYRKDGTITHTAILREAKAHCRHEIPLEKVFEEEPRDEAGKTATRE